MNTTSSSPNTIYHALSAKDKAVVETIREVSTPFNGPEDRAAYDQLMEGIPDAEGVSYSRAEVGGISGVWCKPTNAPTNKALLYLHGGAYVFGSADAYRHFAGQFASRTNTCTFVADYRLAPECRFPAAVSDAKAAYQGLVAQGVKEIVIIGDSAGGGLALILLAIAESMAQCENEIAPKACVVMSPWTDLALTGSSFATHATEDPFITFAMLKRNAELYLNAENPRNPQASPIYGKLSGLPPIQIHVGTSEVLLDDSIQYANLVHATGGNITTHVWQGMPHVFPSGFAMLEAAEQALGLMSNFILEKLNC